MGIDCLFVVVVVVVVAELEFESTPWSAFASVRGKLFLGFMVETNLDLRLEKSGEFGFVNAGEDLKEHLLAERAPPGAWLSTSIFWLLEFWATDSFTALTLLYTK